MVIYIFTLYSTSFVMGYIIYYAQYLFIKYAFVSKYEGQKKPFWKRSKKLVVQLVSYHANTISVE